MNSNARSLTVEAGASRPSWPTRLWRAFQIGVTRRMDLLSVPGDSGADGSVRHHVRL